MCLLQTFYTILLFLFCQRTKLVSTESYLHVYMQSLGRVLKNLQSSIEISSAFLMNLYLSPVSAHASASLWYMQWILNILKAKFVFNLVATLLFLPTMNDGSSETNAFKCNISILGSWNFSVIQETIAFALREQSVKPVSAFSLLQSQYLRNEISWHMLDILVTSSVNNP